MEVNLSARFHIGQVRVFVQEEDQGGPLAALEQNRPMPDEMAGRVEEVLGEGRAVGR
jgi:hypothetical protein